MPQDYYGNIKAGSTAVSVVISLRSTANNSEVTGRLAADITVQYYRQGGVPVSIVLHDLLTVNSPHSPGGIKETSPALSNGVYRLDLPDAAVATDSDFVVVSAVSAGCFVFNERYNLQIDPNLYDAILENQTYANVTYANNYFAGRLNTDAWENSTKSDQQKSLIQATRIIDNLNIAGFKADRNQKLQFPRISRNPNTNPVFMYYLSDPLYVDDELEPTILPTPILPEDIQIATCEIAISLLDERDPDMDYENLRLVNGGMSGSRVTYDPATQQEHIRAGVPSVTAWRRLRPYLVDPNTIELRRVN